MSFFRKHSYTILLLITLFSFNGCDCSNPGNNPAYYTLTVTSENGSINIEPVLEKYIKGSEVTLTAVADIDYDFSAWEGSEESKESPFTFVMDGNKTITGIFTQYFTTNYYVDYLNGNDNNNGLLPATAWKHCPGDSQAESIPSDTELQPGNRIIFKGGTTYRGQISVLADGALSHHIRYEGSSWPGLEDQEAIVDGGDIITDWTRCSSSDDCAGITDYENIYYAYLPGDVDPLSLNLHEYNESTSEDEFLWPAQDPNPSDFYFYDDVSDFRTITQDNLTRTSLSDSGYFTQTDISYWNDSYILIWVNPNIVVTRKIQSYNPTAHTITFEDLGENAIYPDGRDQAFAVFNSPHGLDQSGEYFVTSTPDVQNRLKILLRPRSNANLDNRITYSVRNWAFDIGSRSNITIRGFKIIKHCGSALRDGIGIGTISASHLYKYNLTLNNNIIIHNRKGGSSTGYGGIFLSNCNNVLVENNVITDNPRNSGIFCSGGERVNVRNNNIIRSGATSLRFYGIKKGLIQGNLIKESKGSHANGITIYLGSSNILIAGNRIEDSNSPVTFQDSGNLWFLNNIIDAYEGESNINEWGDTSHGPWERGIVAFINNTLLRNSRNASLNFGGASDENTYISINNIIDGGGGNSSIQRSNNIYTGLAWSQDESYGWALADGEFTESNLFSLFSDPANFIYTLAPASPAIGTGIDIYQYVPSYIFPDFDFSLDIEGNRRTGLDIGAYANSN